MLPFKANITEIDEKIQNLQQNDGKFSFYALQKSSLGVGQQKMKTQYAFISPVLTYWAAKLFPSATSAIFF